jgi:hypothetical protein
MPDVQYMSQLPVVPINQSPHIGPIVWTTTAKNCSARSNLLSLLLDRYSIQLPHLRRMTIEKHFHTPNCLSNPQGWPSSLQSYTL